MFLVLENWGQPHMKYMVYLSLLNTINAIGYYMEITAPTPEAAIVAYKVQYFAGNYLGPFVLLFSFDYSNRPMRNRLLFCAVFILPVFITLVVQLNPALYIRDITFVPSEEILKLSFKPAGLYIANFIYGFTCTVFGSIFTVVQFINTNRKGWTHGIVFFGLIILPLLSKFLWWLGVFPEIEFFYICTTFMLFSLYWYIMRYRQIEWFNLGREAIMERLSDAVMIVNAAQVILNVNSIFFQFFPGFFYIEGRTTLSDFREYLKGRTIPPLPQSLFDDIDPAMQDFYEFTMIPEPENFGERRTYTLTWQTIRAKKKFLGQVIILNDVSAYRTMIEEIIDLKQRAEEASKSKSEFLATVSHEIRTPLNAIIGLSDIQLQNDLSEESRVDLEKIYTSGLGLLAIINDILDISKIETGNFELIPVSYSIPSFVNDTVQLNIIRIGSKDIQFRLDIDDSFPSKLWGDEKRVRQILNNLLSNAFKYTQEGVVSLQMRWDPQGNSGKVTFIISDTGQGIKSEDKKKLFSQYGQLNARANRNIEGTGLGLSITKNLVELMNGTIDVESEFKKGSTFTVTIIQGLNDLTPIGKETAESLRQLRFIEHRRDIEKVRAKKQYLGGNVLVVDDVETNLYVAQGLLRAYGVTIDCVKSGQEAITKILFDNRYNLVFMDHMMPGMDGIETTHIIRKHPSEYAKTLPIIALTANAIVGMREMFLENGFNDYLSKPIEWSKLDDIMTKWMPDPAVLQSKGLVNTSAEKSAAAPEPSAKRPNPNKPRTADPEIPPIEGLDVKQGIIFTGGSPKLYRNILTLYCRDVAERLDILSEIPQPEKIRDFTTHVHALKSASANIGADGIRRRAAELETAAKGGDVLFIERHLAEFIVDLKALIAHIQTALYPSGKALPEDALMLTASDREALARLRKVLEAEEIQSIETVLQNIKNGNFSPAIQQVLDDISGNILVSEFKEAIAVIDVLLKEPSA
jgi:signal transduction histidine kinase/DNA-binding NarL/FixJ family response regulator/HPt (histidine-containing phosphotransfer) domain-containing protein